MAARRDPIRVLLLGQTGAGKSQFAIKLAEHLGHVGPTPFVPSAGVESHTAEPVTLAVRAADGTTFEITDTPGLMDTAGRERDIANITTIVNKAKTFPAVHAVLLVMNEQNPRFDAAMQDCVKLLVDSLGPGMLAHLGIVFTRAFGEVTVAASKAKAADMARAVAARTGVPATIFPSWQVDANIAGRRGATPEDIATRTAAVAAELDACIGWARVQTPLPTLDFKVGEYAETKRLREESERRAAAEAAAAREAAARAATEETARRDAEARAAAAEAARIAEEARVAAVARAAADAAARRAAEQREAEARRHKNDTFLNSHGFKVGGFRIW